MATCDLCQNVHYISCCYDLCEECWKLYHPCLDFCSAEIRDKYRRRLQHLEERALKKLRRQTKLSKTYHKVPSFEKI